MKQVIHDKIIAVCICGKEEKTMERTAKQRVTTWLGVAGLICFLAVVISGGFYLEEWLDPLGLIVIGFLIYAVTGMSAKVLIRLKKGHNIRCSIRYAFYSLV